MTSEWVDVARRQAGAVSAGQLVTAGESPKRLLRQGVITRVQRGLYLLAGAERTWMCSLWLGLLAGGPEAFACRRSAAALWGLDGVARDHIDLGVPAVDRPRSVTVVRYRSLSSDDRMDVHGVPSTSPARTLLDLGCVASASVVERALESALRHRLTSLAAVERVSAIRGSGGSTLRTVLGRRPPDAAPTESDAETLFVLLARSMGLPDPVRQYEVTSRGRTYRLDFAWPEPRLAVEVDGAAVHGPGRLTDDLRRQNRIVLSGWIILRFTWPLLVYEEDIVRRDLAAAWRSTALQRTRAI